MKERILFSDSNPDYSVITTKHFNVHQDWCTPIPGFFIIAAERNIGSIADFSEGEAAEFIKLLRMLRKGMREKLGIKHVVLFQNEDTEWKDFHIWIFPRYHWMEKFGKGSQSLKLIKEHAKENMLDEKTKGEIKNAVAAMKDYLSKNLT